MPIQSELKVIKHTYPNGSTSYRVTGTIDGKQVRKNFKKRADALQEKRHLTSDKLNAEPHARAVWTTLSPAENRDAIAAVSKLRLAKSKKTLSFAVDFMLKHYIGGAEDILADIRSTHKLGHEGLRHTYISMTVGAFKSVGDATLQAGNSEAVIRRHYLDLKTEAEADAFWRVMPKGRKLPEKLEKKDGVWVEVPPEVAAKPA